MEQSPGSERGRAEEQPRSVPSKVLPHGLPSQPQTSRPPPPLLQPAAQRRRVPGACVRVPPEGRVSSGLWRVLRSRFVPWTSLLPLVPVLITMTFTAFRMFPPRFSSPPCGPFGIHRHSPPPFMGHVHGPPPFMDHCGFTSHWDGPHHHGPSGPHHHGPSGPHHHGPNGPHHHRPCGPHHGPMRPHHPPFGPPARGCSLWSGPGWGWGWGGLGSSALIAATYYLARHLWLSAGDLHQGATPTPPPASAPAAEDLGRRDEAEDSQQQQQQQLGGEAGEQDQLYQQETCELGSEVWRTVGGDVWTAEVVLGPFQGAEVEVVSDGRTGVEVSAAHRHGDLLVASMTRHLPPPPCAAPFVVSHAHTTSATLITARPATSAEATAGGDKQS